MPLGPHEPQTDEDHDHLLFLAARLSHPDATIAGVVDDLGRLVAVEFTLHQPSAQVLGDARVLDAREPIGSGIHNLDEQPALAEPPLNITHTRPKEGT